MTNSSQNLKPILNIAFENFWDKDEIIFEHYFKTSHCFLFEKYDIRLSNQPDVVFASIFGNLGASSFLAKVPKILLIHENQPMYVQNELSDSYNYIISFTPDSPLPNHVRIPYWVYRIFDHVATLASEPYDFFDAQETRINFEYDLLMMKLHGNARGLHPKSQFCAYLHGKPIPYRETMVNKLSEYRKVDCGGSHLFNLTDQNEIDYMKQRLYGIEANIQKRQFFRPRNFSFAMENSWTEGYVTEKIIDSLVAGTIPLYCGMIPESDGFNLKAMLNLYNYDSFVPFLDDVKRIDSTPELYTETIQQPAFIKVPERFRKDAMLDTYEKMIGGSYVPNS